MIKQKQLKEIKIRLTSDRQDLGNRLIAITKSLNDKGIDVNIDELVVFLLEHEIHLATEFKSVKKEIEEFLSKQNGGAGDGGCFQ